METVVLMNMSQQRLWCCRMYRVTAQYDAMQYITVGYGRYAVAPKRLWNTKK